jgi:hypothetical protein
LPLNYTAFVVETAERQVDTGRKEGRKFLGFLLTHGAANDKKMKRLLLLTVPIVG